MIKDRFLIAVGSERYLDCDTHARMCQFATTQYSVPPTAAQNQSLYPQRNARDDGIIWAPFPNKAADLSLLLQVQTGPRAHTASYAMVIGALPWR